MKGVHGAGGVFIGRGRSMVGRVQESSRGAERPARGVWGVRDGARVRGVEDRVARCSELGQFWPAPSV